MYPKGPFSCLFNPAGCITGDSGWDCQPSPPITPLPLYLITTNEILCLLPQEADLVPFSSSFLGVDSQVGEPLPVVHTHQGDIPDLGDELALN